MSLSKRAYEAGFVGEIRCKHPVLNVGQRFTTNYSNIKITHGTWEIISNKNAPTYTCRKVLKNGELSIDDTLKNKRDFNEYVIYQALKKD